MKYDIYFHNDFDGRASAAVMLAFLRSRGDDIEHFVPVDYDQTEQYFKNDFFATNRLFKGKHNPAIVMDFLFHPKAAFWFDHHSSTFRRKGWKRFFKPSKFHVLDPHSLSCCHLAYDALRKNFGWKPPRHLAELVRWLDVVDSARYASAKQTIEMKEPALCVDAFIDKTRKDGTVAAWMVTLLSERPLTSIATVPKVKKMAIRVRKENKKALLFYRRNLQPFGTGTFIDLIGARSPMLRHAPYYLFPKLMYAVRFTMKGKFYHVGVGANPWLRGANTVNIGDLLGRYGGGGHKGAGAVDFATRKEALRAVDGIIKVLNKSGGRKTK